ncbi:hypothetical protein L1987_08447 [Smallanthus sonchifolius]|uniref:Uncharacterized protein n=1 Tax=Smallanthus sonchifolius TaxID=185202 RepID=A0ACB9JL68_9ASTR|nr:hypothetical protein L1987_08447 [Smallanthus sonchifolius]
MEQGFHLNYSTEVFQLLKINESSRPRLLCCPLSPICFRTVFFRMTVQTALYSKLDEEMTADPNVFCYLPRGWTIRL